MNSTRTPVRRPIRPPADPIRFATRRLSSLLVVIGAIGGLAIASLLDRAGAPIPVAMTAGLVLFVATAFVATGGTAREARAKRRDAGGVSETDQALHAGGWLGEWGRASQLGPDPEQILGRETGARS